MQCPKLKVRRVICCFCFYGCFKGTNKLCCLKRNHTGANFITMLVTRARANSSKNNTLLMCRIWKMGRNLFSSLDIRDNFKVAFLEKKSNNPKIYLVTITVWGTGSVINWVNLSCWLPDLKVDIWQNLPKKCHFQIISHVQWWTNFFFLFLHSAYQEGRSRYEFC